MAYKDKDRQREAQRERTRRYRAKHKSVTCNAQDVTPTVRAGVRVFDNEEEAVQFAEECVREQLLKPFAGQLTKERQVSRKGFNK